MDKLTHFNEQGQARMVDITNKKATLRVATASCEVHMKSETLKQIVEGSITKGNVLAVAQTAGIMAAKKTYEIIPMCHNIPLSSANIEFENASFGIIIKATIKTNYGTGVEMEALTACCVTALTIYDMVKAIDKKIVIQECKLLHKSGGKSGEFCNE